MLREAKKCVLEVMRQLESSAVTFALSSLFQSLLFTIRLPPHLPRSISVGFSFYSALNQPRKLVQNAQIVKTVLIKLISLGEIRVLFFFFFFKPHYQWWLSVCLFPVLTATLRNMKVTSFAQNWAVGLIHHPQPSLEGQYKKKRKRKREKIKKKINKAQNF